MTRIFLVDDHAIVRAGLKHLLTESGADMHVVGEASNGEEAIERILAEDGIWDIVLLDISMPGKDGLEVLKKVRKARPSLPILILTMHDEELLALRYLKAGASGYVTKDSAPDQLVQAIEHVIGGRRYINPDLAERLVMEWDTDVEQPLHTKLSDREYTVLCRIASGRTVSLIAKDLSLSPRTVSTYRSRILEKMKMKNNAELTHYALKLGLVE